MLIHEGPKHAVHDEGRRWTEISAIGMAASLALALCAVWLRGFPKVEPHEPEASAAVGLPKPIKTEKPPAVVDDPNWVPTDVVVFRARVERFVVRPPPGAECALGAPALKIVQVLEGRLGVVWLGYSPRGTEFGKTYTFRWKPTIGAKEALKSARRNGENTVHLWFWEKVEVVEDQLKS